MSKISIYDVVPVPKLADKLIGTSVGGEPEDLTYNFTLGELLNLFIPNIPGNTLQGVLDFGNTATQNINLTGTINTTDLNVGGTLTILDSDFTGETHILGGLYDSLNSIGTPGQVLISTGTQVEWFTIPTVIPNLQQVLASGNTAVNNIILTGNLSANNAALLTSTISTSLTLLGTLRDGLNAVGANNQVLSSSVTGVRWVNLPVYSAASPLLYNSGTGVFSIQQANASQGGFLSAADWITFDGKQTAISLTTAGNSGPSTLVGSTINVPNYTLAGLNGVPQTRTLTINGETYNLSADRSWTISAGVSSVTATSPLFSTGGATPDISIQQSSSSLDGYLSSVDWLIFNDKQNFLGGTGLVKSVGGVISYITDNSANWNTAYNDSIVSAAVTGTTTKLLTLNQQDGGTITASWSDIDTGLTSVGVSMPTAFTVTNSPLTSNGTIAITGSGNSLQYIDGTGALQTFPSLTGYVPYTGATQNVNLGIYSLTASSLIKNGGTSSQFLKADGSVDSSAYIILGSLSASSPLVYNNLTGAFSIIQSGTVTDGYLSSTDWNTFNGKQGAITLTTTGTSGPATLIGNTLNIPQYTDQFVGTVTSVGLSMPAAFTVSNSPVTSAGTLTVLGAGTAAQYVRGDGSLGDFPSGGGGGGSSVSYYLNGSISQGTIGGVAYRELSKVPIFGAGTDISINANGYIASFITDAGDPALLEIPAGNWNFETYFSASSGGGSPTFYIELYKVNSGGTATLIASNSGTPESISLGTNINPYFSALAVPQTTLALTDRLAVRYYVSTSGRTITLHTENGHLCQIITTFTTGLTALNGLTTQVQFFSTGTAGTDFNISSSVATHTFNLPTASATDRGALSSADWITFNSKQPAGNYVTLDTTQTITGLKTILRGGDVLDFKIGTDTLYGLKIAYNQNELVPSGEATWSFVNTFNNGSGTGLTTTPISFFRGVLVTGDRLLSVSVNANLLDYYGNNPSGRYPIYAYNTGVQQFQDSILVGFNTGVVNAVTGAIASLPAGVVANFNGRVIGIDAINNNEFATLGQVTSTSRAAISLTTTGTSGPATYNNTTGVFNIPEYAGTVNPSAREIQTYIATASQTTFTVTGGYTVGLVDVFINGVRLTSSDYTATNGTTVVLTVGTMAGNIVDIIKYTSGIVNSISGSGTTNELAYFTASTTIASLTTATYPSLTELSYVKGVTSSIQTQLNGKQSTLTNPVTGTGTSGTLPKFTGSTTIGNSNLINDSSGNLGLGITPSAWGTDFRAIQIGTSGGTSISSDDWNGFTEVLNNVYGSARNTYTRIQSLGASRYSQQFGTHVWYSVGAGSGGTTVSFTPVMTLTNANLLVGTSTDNGFKLDVNGTGRFTQNVTIGAATAATNVKLIFNGVASKAAGIEFHQSGTPQWYIGNGIASEDNNFELYNSNGTMAMKIIKSTNVINFIGAATFSSSVTANGLYANAGNSARFYRGANDYYWGVFNDSNNFLNFGTFAANGTAYGTNPKLILLDNGNVGIGLNNPERILTIYNSNSATLYQTPTSGTTANSGFYVGQTGDVSYVYNYNSFPLVFATANTERMRITSGGAICVNRNDAPYGNFAVKSNSSTSYAGLNVYASTSERFIALNHTGSEGIIETEFGVGGGFTPLSFKTGGSERMRITSGGNVLIGTTTDIGERITLNGRIGIVGATVASGNSRSFFVRGAQSVADGGTLSINVTNTALIFIAENNTGTGALFFCGYASATITKISDPSNMFDTADTAGKLCIFKSGVSDVATIKNRLGSTKSITVSYIGVSD
jgi:hypothetical protein